jgi:hypothetical protein
MYTPQAMQTSRIAQDGNSELASKTILKPGVNA